MTYEDEPYLIYGIIGVILFRFWSVDKKCINLIAIFALGIFLSQYLCLNSFITIQVAEIVWAISSSGLIIFYSLRFKSKSEKQVIDYIKIIGLTLLITYPISFWYLTGLSITPFWHLILYATPYFLATIFIYDRLILKPEPMKKKFIIALIAQTVLIFMLFIFALVQKMEADKNRIEAVRQHEEAVNRERLVVALQKELNSLRKSNK
jgi:hypothetical protein